MQHVWLETPERENKGWKTRRSFSLRLSIFEVTKYKLNSYVENLISFSLIYRFVGLRYEITEICSINRENTAQTEQ